MRCVVDVDGNNYIVGVTGTVIRTDGDGTKRLGVRWDEPNGMMHTCGGACENNYGWWVPESCVERVYEDAIEDAALAVSMDLLFA